MTDQGIAAWKLPLIVAAIAIAIIAAFYVGGPGMGMAEGSIVAGIIVVMAVRHPPTPPIRPPEATDLREHLLVVVDQPLEDGAAIERIAAASVPLDPAEPEPEVRVVAPAHNRFLDRWACDVGPGRAVWFHLTWPETDRMGADPAEARGRTGECRIGQCPDRAIDANMDC